MSKDEILRGGGWIHQIHSYSSAFQDTFLFGYRVGYTDSAAYGN
ncbi:unnamed protein product, partial [Adineta ricciae]